MQKLHLLLAFVCSIPLAFYIPMYSVNEHHVIKTVIKFNLIEVIVLMFSAHRMLFLNRHYPVWFHVLSLSICSELIFID